MIPRSKTRTCSDSRVSRLFNQSTITCIISDKLGSSWLLLPPNGLYKAWSWPAFIIATVFSMVYQLCIFPNCNVFDSEFRSATLSPIHPGTVILTQCCLHCIGYRWSSEFAIKSLWSLSRLFTIWGLRILSNLINIKRCSRYSLRSNVGVILQDPTAKFKCTLGTDHLLQLLQRYGTV